MYTFLFWNSFFKPRLNQIHGKKKKLGKREWESENKCKIKTIEYQMIVVIK